MDKGLDSQLLYQKNEKIKNTYFKILGLYKIYFWGEVGLQKK